MPTREAIAERFRNLDFHDDTFVNLTVLPAQRPEEALKSVVEIRLHQHVVKNLWVIRFSGCTNLRVAMDFDVLVGNAPINTSRVDAHTRSERLHDFMKSQEQDWDVHYSPGMSSPLDWKLNALDELVFFRVQFFGGAVDVIAMPRIHRHGLPPHHNSV